MTLVKARNPRGAWAPVAPVPVSPWPTHVASLPRIELGEPKSNIWAGSTPVTADERKSRPMSKDGPEKEKFGCTKLDWTV